MSTGIVIAGEWHAGKTTACQILADHYRDMGFAVANIQVSKGIDDVYQYQAGGYMHYTVPLEAAKGKDDLEKWLPVGYDYYILEWTYPHHPEFAIATAYLDIFEQGEVNEIVPWSDYFAGYRTSHAIAVSRCNYPLWDVPGFSPNRQAYHPELLIQIDLNPQLQIPRSGHAAMGLGYFPGEWFDVFPNFRWYQQDHARFFQDLHRNNPDQVILGHVHSSIIPAIREAIPEISCSVLSYCPEMHSPADRLSPITCAGNLLPDAGVTAAIRAHIRDAPVGSPFPAPPGNPDDYYYTRFDNLFWTRTEYRGVPVIRSDSNLTVCNGWVHPMYLIQGGYVCV